LITILCNINQYTVWNYEGLLGQRKEDLHVSLHASFQQVFLTPAQESLLPHHHHNVWNYSFSDKMYLCDFRF